MTMQPAKALKSKSQKRSTVRIIAGQYRRRLVEFIELDGLRPTPDRVRETLFNWLADDLPNAHVLDCCAGSGVLGFESLSRGAKHVVMIEPVIEQARQLASTQQQLAISSDKITLITNTAQQALPTLATVFDVVFIDPPYRLDLWQDLLNALTQTHLIDPHTLIYIEADRPHETILADLGKKLTVIKSKKMGQIYCGIYQLN